MGTLTEELDKLRQDLRNGAIDKETFKLLAEALAREGSSGGRHASNITNSAVNQGDNGIAAQDAVVNTGDENVINQGEGSISDVQHRLRTLQKELAKLPAEQKAVGDTMLQEATVLAEEAEKEEPDPEVIAQQESKLKMGTFDIMEVMPTVRNITLGLISAAKAAADLLS